MPASTSLDRRLPDVTTVMVFKKLGWSTQDIADYFAITKSQADTLVQATKRQTIAEAAKDFVHTQLLPKVLVSLDKALDSDPEGKLALQIADRVGILQGPQQETAEESGSFEEYRMTVLRRRTNAAPPKDESLDAASVIDVSHTIAESLQADSADPRGSDIAENAVQDDAEGTPGGSASDREPAGDGALI